MVRNVKTKQFLGGRIALSVLLLAAVSCAHAGNLRSARDLIDAVGKTGIVGPALPELLAQHGIRLAETGDQQGRLRGRDFALEDGMRIRSVVLLPDANTVPGQLFVQLDDAKCLPVAQLQATYGLKDAPISVTAPAPSLTPSKRKPSSPGLAQGTVGKVTLQATYSVAEGKSVADACVESLVFK